MGGLLECLTESQTLDKYKPLIKKKDKYKPNITFQIFMLHILCSNLCCLSIYILKCPQTPYSHFFSSTEDLLQCGRSTFLQYAIWLIEDLLQYACNAYFHFEVAAT